MKIVFSPDARADLSSLLNYIFAQSDSAKIAHGYIDRIIEAATLLETFPEAGRKCDDIQLGLRSLPFERRAILTYRLHEAHVEILNVYYGGRDFERLLSEKP